MRRTLTIAGFAAALAVSMPMAFAADMNSHANPAPTPSDAAAPAKTSVTATSIKPDQIRASQLKGSDVYDAQNKKIGSVKDIIIDKSGQVAAMVIDVDGRDVGLAMNDVKIAMDKDNNPKVTVDKSKQELKSAQAFQLNTATPKTGSSTPPEKTPTPPAGSNK
jgi:sporulation protein YlmC with PRC-barrel domain